MIIKEDSADLDDEIPFNFHDKNTIEINKSLSLYLYKMR